MKIKTKQLDFDKVKSLQKPEHKNPSKPNFLISSVIRLGSIPDLMATNFTYTQERMDLVKDKPCLILMNHSSFIDLKIASKIFYPKPYGIVCTSDGFIGKRQLMRMIGCIPTQKFVSDFTLIEDIKYMLLIISSVIQNVKQDIKDEGKSQKYNQIIKCAESIDTKVAQDTYTEECYTEMFEALKTYVNYINDNYDISKLPNDEKDIIELVIEATINGLDSDIDRLNYEFSLIINICKNAYRYFKIVDKVFVKIQSVYDESLVRDSINLQDYVNFYKDMYDHKIKTMVNDVHRTIKTEDEYLEYSRQLHEDDGIYEFILARALETTENVKAKDIISLELEKIAAEKQAAIEAEQAEQEENAESSEATVQIIEEIYELVGEKTELTETENV